MKELFNGTMRSMERNGMHFTNKANGDSVFMPFAGSSDGSGVNGVGKSGYAWTSPPSANGTFFSCGINASIDLGGVIYVSIIGEIRQYGFVVRGVC